MASNKDKIVVTAALPYANGDIHIGHLLEYIQTDIFVKFLKLSGKEVLYICASDMHGTPIEVNAKKAGVSPEKFVEKYWNEHQKDFASFLINFDNFYKTHSPENKELAEYFYKTLKDKNLIYTKEIDIIYCETCKRSLPDRFVKGKCPKCDTEDQYGDICESCSTVLKGTDLVDPYCSICESKPINKKSTHYFFKLSDKKVQTELKKWLEDKKSEVQPTIQKLLKNWFDKGLEDWCISRDGPYFGFEIPNSKKETGETKYFYVWLDAPIGYISSTKNYCDKNGGKWEDYWNDGQVYHFIGKDIVYFHYLFWPAMLKWVGIKYPKLTTHGFVNVNGQKMSKSRGTFFTAKDFLKLYPAEALRFFYAHHLDKSVLDIDLNFESFIAVNNNVLLGNLGNFCYRVLTFAQKNYGDIKSVIKDAKKERIVNDFIASIKKNYEEQKFRLVVKDILRISDLGNQVFQDSNVWKDKESKKSKEIVGWCVNLARNLAILVSPILPEFSKKIYTALGEKELLLDDVSFEWKGKLKKVDFLVEKIDKIPEKNEFPLQLKVGQIKEVKDHPDAEKLYLLKVDFKDEKRQVVAGLKKYFKPQDLLDRKTVFCVNLKPAKLRGEMSEAMILVAEEGKDKLAFLEIEDTKNVGGSVEFDGLQSSTKEASFDEFVKLKMIVKSGKIVFDGKKLVGVTVKAKDGAKVS